MRCYPFLFDYSIVVDHIPKIDARSNVKIIRCWSTWIFTIKICLLMRAFYFRIHCSKSLVLIMFSAVQPIPTRWPLSSIVSLIQSYRRISKIRAWCDDWFIDILKWFYCINNRWIYIQIPTIVITKHTVSLCFLFIVTVLFVFCWSSSTAAGLLLQFANRNK